MQRVLMALSHWEHIKWVPMTRILMLMLTSVWTHLSCVPHQPQQERPQLSQTLQVGVTHQPLSPYEAKGQNKSPGKKEPRRKRPVNLNRCLDACAAGGAILIDFCNDIEKSDVRRSCFSVHNESEQKCRGFCANYFGN